MSIDRENVNNLGHTSPDKLETCAICNAKCISLDAHIREVHLQQFFVASILQNSFYGSNFANWPTLLPPTSGLGTLNSKNNGEDLSPTSHFAAASLGRSASPNSPKRPKLLSPLLGLPATSSASLASSHHYNSLTSSAGLPLMCNQCSSTQSFPDLQSFRAHQFYHIQSQIAASPHHLLNRLSNGNGSILAESGNSLINDRLCMHCDSMVSGDLESHLINNHLANVSNQYGCESCHKSYSNRDDLQRHLLDSHSKHLYKCLLCSVLFESQSTLREHLIQKHSPACRIYSCKQCNHSCLDEDEFKTHFRLHFSGPALAGGLPYHHLHPSITHLSSPVSISSSSSSSVHHHPSNVFFPSLKPYLKCTLCGDEFHSEYQLDKHYETSHPARRSPQSPTSASSPAAPASSAKSLSDSREARKRAFDEDSGSASDRESLNSSPPQPSVSPAGSGSPPPTVPASGSATAAKSGRQSGDLVSAVSGKASSKSPLPSPSKCNICDEICISSTDLTTHKLHRHCMFPPGLADCSHCHTVIKSREEFMDHLALHNRGAHENGEEISLNGIKSESKSSSSYSIKSLISSIQWPVTCVICKLSLNAVDDAKIHSQFHCNPSESLLRGRENEFSGDFKINSLRRDLTMNRRSHVELDSNSSPKQLESEANGSEDSKGDTSEAVVNHSQENKNCNNEDRKSASSCRMWKKDYPDSDQLILHLKQRHHQAGDETKSEEGCCSISEKSSREFGEHDDGNLKMKISELHGGNSSSMNSDSGEVDEHVAKRGHDRRRCEPARDEDLEESAIISSFSDSRFGQKEDEREETGGQALARASASDSGPPSISCTL